MFHALTARATDNLNGTTTSVPIDITVTAQAALYFIHPDHLNTPRVITNQAQQVVWRWDNDDPFGANMANENPSGLGTFTCNLRFPGQYFDKETNQHYNYFRDYSPEIGRYVQSDPIGLRGGTNTYAYVAGNPLSKTDPEGLIAATQPISWTSAQSSVLSPTTSPPSQNQNICQVDRMASCNALFVQCINKKPRNSTLANDCARSFERCIKGFPAIFPGGGFAP